MNPHANLNRKLKAIENRKALLDSLASFLKKHPEIAEATTIKPLANGRTGLYFWDAALIRPIWERDRVVLRLERYREDYGEDSDYEPWDREKATVSADITNLSEDELEAALRKAGVEFEDHEEN